MADDSKECPLQYANIRTDDPSATCQKDRCAWWDDEENQCIIAVMSRNLSVILSAYGSGDPNRHSE